MTQYLENHLEENALCGPMASEVSENQGGDDMTEQKTYQHFWQAACKNVCILRAFFSSPPPFIFLRPPTNYSADSIQGRSFLLVN